MAKDTGASQTQAAVTFEMILDLFFLLRGVLLHYDSRTTSVKKLLSDGTVTLMQLDKCHSHRACTFDKVVWPVFFLCHGYETSAKRLTEKCPFLYQMHDKFISFHRFCSGKITDGHDSNIKECNGKKCYEIYGTRYARVMVMKAKVNINRGFYGKNW